MHRGSGHPRLRASIAGYPQHARAGGISGGTVAEAQVASFEDQGLARRFDPLPLHHPFPSNGLQPSTPASTDAAGNPPMGDRINALSQLTPSPGIHAGLSAGAQVERNFLVAAYDPPGSGTPDMVIAGQLMTWGSSGD
jgi:hypothetical protein